MLKPAVKSSSTQLSIYLAISYDLVWMWLLYYEIFNFMTLLSLFPKGCRILRWDDVQELYQKILNNNDIRLIHVSWFHGKARKTSWGEGSFQFLSSFTECRPFRIPFATGLIKVGMIFTFVHLDLLLPPLPHACQASQERKTDKKTRKNKGKTKCNIKILWAFSFLEPFWGAYVWKGQGSLIFEIRWVFFLFCVGDFFNLCRQRLCLWSRVW